MEARQTVRQRHGTVSCQDFGLTLNPQPHTLNTIPYILYPIPSTVNLRA